MKTREDVALALDRLAERLETPRALEPGAAERLRAQEALSRARQQLVAELPPVLVVAIAGGTGVGKSTLINALAGAPIAETSAERPTTTHVKVYHHEDVELGGLPADLGYGARFVAHRREELRWKVLVDTPDLDSFVREHRQRTRRLLRSAGLVLYVFSPEKYLEERSWSVLRQERRFSATAVVLNKVDTLLPDEIDKVADDLRERLAGAGLEGARLFRTSALRGAGAALPERRVAVDETALLRSYLEDELEHGDATRIAREARRRVVLNLRQAVESAAPAEPGRGLERAEARLPVLAEGAGQRLVECLAEELEAVEAELLPLATLRAHERFHGPFRAWLALADFVTIGLSGLVDRLAGRPARGSDDVVERVLGRARAGEVDAIVRELERLLQDELYAQGLPLGRWREVAGETRGENVLSELAASVRRRFESRAGGSSTRGGSLVWVASKLGGLVPAAVVALGLLLVVRDLWTGQYLGFGLLGHLFALVVLFFLALHGIVSVLMPGGGRVGRGIGLAAAREVLPEVASGWLARYSADLEADLADLAGPLDDLARALGPEALAPPAEPAPAAWPTPDEAPAAEPSPSPPAPAPDPEERLLRALERPD